MQAATAGSGGRFRLTGCHSDGRWACRSNTCEPDTIRQTGCSIPRAGVAS
jgi:hypothetical protein